MRLEVEDTIDPHVLELLVRELGIEAQEVVAIPGPLDLTGLMAVAASTAPSWTTRPSSPDATPT